MRCGPGWVERGLMWLLRIYGVVVLVGLGVVPLRFLPAEDAVILFQYSRNLAEHGVISFLAGGPRVEGATDFAWMVLIAGAHRLGVAAFGFAAGVNVCVLVGLGAVLCRLARARVTAARVLAVAGAAGLMPQMLAAAGGFAVLPDALLLAVLALAVAEEQVAGACLAGLALCLFRPDGVVFAVPMLASLLVDGRERGRRAAVVAGCYVVPGLLYFAWRWHYFGEMWPLPFVVKTDTPRAMGWLVWRSVRTSVAFLVFTGVVLWPVRWRGRNLRFAVGLVVVPTLFYWGVRLDQNVGFRFFFYLPLAAAILLAMSWDRLGHRRGMAVRVGFAAWAMLLAMPLWREIRTFRDEQFYRVRAIAEGLGRLPGRGTMVTTEAGFLPYSSGWTTYDAWGLNTPEFAHRYIQPGDVERIAPDLIVLHPDRGEGCVAEAGWAAGYRQRTWVGMTRNLIEGAGTEEYELWLTSYGSEFYRRRKGWGQGQGDRECWLVRRGSRLRDGVVGVLVGNGAVRG